MNNTWDRTCESWDDLGSLGTSPTSKIAAASARNRDAPACVDCSSSVSSGLSGRFGGRWHASASVFSQATHHPGIVAVGASGQRIFGDHSATYAAATWSNSINTVSKNIET